MLTNRFNVIPWQNLRCAYSLPYLTQIMITAAIPIFLFVFLCVCFLLPMALRDRLDMSDINVDRFARKRTRIKFFQLLMMLIFIFYPFITSQLWSVFACWSVGDELLLRADMGVSCQSAVWKYYAFPMLLPALVYSFGIPIWYLRKLRSLRERLWAPEILLMYGFLYEVTETFFVVVLFLKTTSISILLYYISILLFLVCVQN